jgi:LacI family transcriptional regulator
MNAPAVTRRDVAREAGTSVAVVSYVVNNGPRPVAPATRQRVLDAIERTGYRPNIVARSLRSGSTRTYGFVVPNISNPFIGQIAHEVEERVFHRDCVLLLGDSADDKDREAALIDNFLERQVDGLIYMGVDQELSLERARSTHTPIVVFTHANSDGVAPSVRIDERAAVRAATSHLIGHGRRRVAMVTGPSALLNSSERLAGWRDAVADAGSDAALVQRADYSRPGGYAAGLAFLAQETLPDAVMAGNERQAMGLIAALTDHGVRVPDDVAVFALNGTPDAVYSIPPLSVVVQPIAAMAERVLDVLANPEAYGTDPIEMDFELVPRASCGCDFSRPSSLELG